MIISENILNSNEERQAGRTPTIVSNNPLMFSFGLCEQHQRFSQIFLKSSLDVACSASPSEDP